MNVLLKMHFVVCWWSLYFKTVIRGFTQMTSNRLGIPHEQLGKNIWGLPRLPRCLCAPDLDKWQDNACMDSSYVVYLHQKKIK